MADDLGERLNSLLSDPQALASIMSMISGLTGASRGTPNNTSIRDDLEPSEPFEPRPSQQIPDFAPEPKLPPLPSLVSDDSSCELLRALKPYLRSARADKIDLMIRVLQISRLARTSNRF